MSTQRAIGPFNGILPIPTGMVIGFVRDPKTFAYLQYAQMVPAPDIVYEYFTLDPDEPARMVDVNQYAWAYDDYRPSGRGETLAGSWTPGYISRWDFPYQLGETTQRVWQKNGVDTRQVFNQVKAAQAGLHRAYRVVNKLNNASFPTGMSSDLNTLLGTSGQGFDTSSGTQYDPSSGAPNDSFQVIRRALNTIKRRIHLATNGVVGRNDLVLVVPPLVAQKMGESGEIFEVLKQQQGALNQLVEMPDNWADWNLPPKIAGVRIVVEDTVRVFINRHADGTVASVTSSTQKDYILNSDTCYVVSRPGGLDGGYGFQNFSSIQIYHYGGEARTEAFTEPKHQLVEGHIVMEDNIETPTLLSAFKLTDVLTT